MLPPTEQICDIPEEYKDGWIWTKAYQCDRS
jgi:hypothetical protein